MRRENKNKRKIGATLEKIFQGNRKIEFFSRISRDLIYSFLQKLKKNEGD